MMESGERLAVFCNAERNARERAKQDVVEVDRIDEWVARTLRYRLDEVFGDYWRTVDMAQLERLQAAIAMKWLKHSGVEWYAR